VRSIPDTTLAIKTILGMLEIKCAKRNNGMNMRLDAGGFNI
jgi:hypothetical protein